MQRVELMQMCELGNSRLNTAPIALGGNVFCGTVKEKTSSRANTLRRMRLGHLI